MTRAEMDHKLGLIAKLTIGEVAEWRKAIPHLPGQRPFDGENAALDQRELELTGHQENRGSEGVTRTASEPRHRAQAKESAMGERQVDLFGGARQ